MTWTETHDRWRVLQEVEAAANADGTGELLWKPEYAAHFNTPQELVAALAHRWDLMIEAQLDPALHEDYLDERRRDLVREHAGLLRVLKRYPRARAQSAASTDLAAG